MTESMAILFKECEGGGNTGNLCDTAQQWHMVNSLLLATVLRTMLVIVSYGCKVPAGIFVPSMAIGASFGRMVGIMVKALYQAYPKSGMFAYCKPDIPCITPGTYAFLGAAAALSGVMRITVSVVVIMFELTGALTYILPTMIVILVTKAVGDIMGTTGIADEMIRFNRYPYLESEELDYSVPVSTVMRQDLTVLTEKGMCVRDLEHLLSTTTVKGFPIIAQGTAQILVGHIGRTELRFVLEKATKLQVIRPDTPCSFAVEAGPEVEDAEELELDLVSGPAADIEEPLSSTLIQTAALEGEALKFWPWVNQTPMTVSPQQPLEIVMQLFKRMGPRVILVERHGALAGLVTVKDVLRFIATSEKASHSGDPLPGEAGGLEEFLEELYTSSSMLVERFITRCRGVLTSRR